MAWASGFVGRKADDLGVFLGELLGGIAEFARFLGAAGRIGLGEEEQNDGLALELGELEGTGLDFGGAIAGFERLICRDCKLVRHEDVTDCAGCRGIPDGGAGVSAADAAKGKANFEANCSVCHNADSTERKMGPGLKGLFKHDKLANGKAVNEANVTGYDQ